LNGVQVDANDSMGWLRNIFQIDDLDSRHHSAEPNQPLTHLDVDGRYRKQKMSASDQPHSHQQL